jgi:ABC-type Mn2+/Zn2+ transport system ATPase subunit
VSNIRDAYAISSTGLVVGYGGRPVVSEITLSVERGMTLALVGMNGSGKTTLLRTLAGLLPTVAGTVEVMGARPGKNPRHIAYLSQFHSSELILPLRVHDVVRTARYSVLGLLSRSTLADERLVRAAMERMGVDSLRDESLNTLSGGQRQRVFLAQALARDAELLLLDEPEANLDAAGRETYRQTVRELTGRGRTVVLCTHDVEEAEACDQAMLLANRVVAYGAGCAVLTPETLLSTFGLTARVVDGRVVVLEREHRRECGEEHVRQPH